MRNKPEQVKAWVQTLHLPADPWEGLLELSRRKIAGVALAFCFGVLFSRAVMFSELAPFGMAYVGAVRKKWPLLGATLGAAAGYLLSRDLDSLRYVAAVLILCGGKLLFDGLHLGDKLRYANELLVMTVSLFTGLGALLALLSPPRLVFLLTETALAASFTYFMQLAGLGSAEGTGVSKGEEKQKKAALCLIGAAALLSLSGLYISFFSVGRILATAVILAAGYHRGLRGGAVAGVVCGIAASLGGRELAFMTAAMGAAGLGAGLLSAMPSLMTAAYLLIFWMLGSYFAGTSVLFLMLEAAVGGGLFFCYRLVNRRRETQSPPPLEAEDGRERRRKELSRGIAEFAALLERQIQKGDEGDMTEVFHRCAQQVCAHCGLNVYCWGQDYQKTMDALNRSAELLVQKGKLTAADLEGTILQKCVRSGEFLGKLNGEFQRMQRGLRENELRDLQASVAQYSAFGGLMEELSLPREERRFLCALSDKLLRILRDRQLTPLFAGYYADQNDRLEAVMTFQKPEEITACAKELEECAQAAAGVIFGAPEAVLAPEGVRLTLRQRGKFYLDSHCRSLPKAGERQCGDTIRLFQSRNGDEVVLLCDGMGSGASAREDSLFAVKAMEILVKNGVSAACALRFIGANLNHSGKESFTTVDLFQVSTHTGESLFLKSGAASSFVVSGGAVRQIGCDSLPIGILREASPAILRQSLQGGDVVVLLSDGALSEGGDARPLEDLLRTAWRGEETDVKNLTEQLCTLCQNRRDDVSVAVVKLMTRH